MRSFIKPGLFNNNVPLDNTISDLSDQSAMEIRVRIRVRLKIALF